MNKGVLYAVGAYSAWGLLPVYWKSLRALPALDLLAHRILWSFVTLFAFLLLLRRLKSFRDAARDPRVLRIYMLAAVLIGVNWLTYLWAVNAGFMIETSLGYFINPLISVCMGVLFFRERLRPWQKLPLGLAGAGVLYLAVSHGAVPWIALVLAFTFAGYGAVKKTAPLGSFHGLTLETGVLLIPALLWLLLSGNAGTGIFPWNGILPNFLLVGSGLVTTVPLLMFAAAAKRIPLSLVGILQYISPTLQFLLGALVYGEPFPRSKFIGYGIVWLALVLFAVEGFAAYSSRPSASPADAELFTFD